MKRLITGLAIAGAILATAGGAGVNPSRAHAATTSTPFHTRIGKISGIVPTNQELKTQQGQAASGGPLQYQGGPVMTTNKVYTIFWIPPGFSVAPNYQHLINRFFTDLQHDNGKNTNVYATDTQYYQVVNGQTQYIRYNTSFAGTATDNNPLPPLDPVNCPDANSDTNGTQGTPGTNTGCVTDPQLQQEISSVVKAHGWSVDNNTEVFMYTADNIGSCFSPAIGVNAGPVGTQANVPLCSFEYWCAYHSWYFDSTINPNSQIIYANMAYEGDMAGVPETTCDQEQNPNGADPADAEISVTSHEHNESITDPFQTGWIDPSGNEIGDLCNGSFGTPLNGPSGAQWNQTINGDHYITQMEYSDVDNGCIQVPTPEFTLTPNIGYPSAPFKIDGPAAGNGLPYEGLLFLPANSTVSFTFTSAGSSTAEALGSVTSDATGHAAKFMTSVPADATPGTATVTAVPADGSPPLGESFTVPSP